MGLAVKQPTEIIAVSATLKQSGRDMIGTLSNRVVYDIGPTFVEHANSWRITNDFLSGWTFLANISFCGDRWTKYAGPGHWPDKDMLVCLGSVEGQITINPAPHGVQLYKITRTK